MKTLNIEIHMSFDVVDGNLLSIPELKQLITSQLTSPGTKKCLSFMDRLSWCGYGREGDANVDIIVRDSKGG